MSTQAPPNQSPGTLLMAVRSLSEAALSLEASFERDLSQVHPDHSEGARNLLHYLAVRQHDIRELQRALARLGLSSLGRMESCVLETLANVEHALGCLAGESVAPTVSERLCQDDAQELLARHSAALFGQNPEGRRTQIMVTLNSDDDEHSIAALLREGMNVARINCSKGGPVLWRALVDQIKSARHEANLPCPILFDLAGPNPRSVRLEGKIRKRAAVSDGGRIILASGQSAAERARSDFPKAAIIGCTMPELLGHLKPGERVTYDDGKLECLVVSSDEAMVELEVVRAARHVIKLKDQKTLNFPESDLPFPALTKKDRKDLDFVAKHADIVGLSFVRSARDVVCIQQELAEREASQLGLLLKIETPSAFKDLGRLLLCAMRSPRVGLMVARGDMAVELGFVRLAEAQEEVLWLGEAGLVPVVWATQVLESLTKTGVPSRAEITDAAMSSRAECVMLNRGEHLEEAVAFLHEVLIRMQAHQEKKRSLLRRLSISEVIQEA